MDAFIGNLSKSPADTFTRGDVYKMIPMSVWEANTDSVNCAINSIYDSRYCTEERVLELYYTMVERGFDFASHESEKNSFIMLAITHGYEKVFMFLLQRGVRVDVTHQLVRECYECKDELPPHKHETFFRMVRECVKRGLVVVDQRVGFIEINGTDRWWSMEAPPKWSKKIESVVHRDVSLAEAYERSAGVKLQ